MEKFKQGLTEGSMEWDDLGNEIEDRYIYELKTDIAKLAEEANNSIQMAKAINDIRSRNLDNATRLVQAILSRLGK